MNAGRLITEVILETGWSVRHILDMPALQFFIVRKNIFEIRKDERLHSLLTSCDIQAISWGGSDYLKELKNVYKEELSSSSARRKKLAFKQLDADNKDDTDIVASNLKAAFDTKAKMMGLSRE